MHSICYVTGVHHIEWVRKIAPSSRAKFHRADKQPSFCLLYVFHFIALLTVNPFASGIQKVLLSPIMGLFSVKIRKKFLAIKNFSVNDTMSGQPNKRLIH